MKRIACLLLCLILLCGRALAAQEDATLEKQIEDFRRDHGLTEENFAFSFYNIDTAAQFSFNADAFLPAGNVWTLPLHMYYYEQEELGAFDPPPDDPEYVFTIGGRTLEECRYRSIILNDDDTSAQMRDDLGSPLQYRVLINERYGGYAAEKLPESYLNDGRYSAAFLMNCLRYHAAKTELFQGMMANFRMVQTADGIGGINRSYNLSHIRGEEDGWICDVGQVNAPQPFLLAAFASESVGGDELIAELCELFCGYVEEQSGTIVPTETVRYSGQSRSDSDFTPSAVDPNDNSELMHWLTIALSVTVAIGIAVTVVCLIVKYRREHII